MHRRRALGLFATVRDYGVGGSNPLSPTIYFQQFTEVLRIIKSPNVVESAAVKPPRISKIKTMSSYTTLQFFWETRR